LTTHAPTGLAPRPAAASLASGALLLSACFGTFDPALYMASDAGRDAPADPIDAAMEELPDAREERVDAFSELDAPMPDAFSPIDAAADAPLSDGGPPVFALANYCTDAVPLLDLGAAAARTIAIDTRTLGDDGSGDISMCLGGSPTGPDGFFRFSATARERWHFHYRHVGAVNPALYILETCDLRMCRDNQVIDLCNSGADEHLTFQAATAGSYFVGIDSFNAEGLTGTVEAYRPVCGNGMREHSETCDDGGVVPGDGCDEECRDEITSALTDRGELEVNDDRFSANHGLVTPGTPLTVTGRIATACETDWFVIDLPATGSIQAELLTMAGASCMGSLDVPDPFTLELIASDGLTRIGSGTLASGCPAIDPARDAFATGLPAGRYFLRIFGRADSGRPFNYGMRVTTTTL